MPTPTINERLKKEKKKTRKVRQKTQLFLSFLFFFLVFHYGGGWVREENMILT